MSLEHIANSHWQALCQNPYPGRGIVLGATADGKTLLQAYWLMGRSENSRNRVLVAQGNTLATQAADPAKLKDPALVIYTAMRELPGRYLVTNGDHTDTLYQGLQGGQTFEEALKTRIHEPDGPNWTPRIAGEIALGAAGPTARLAVIKADPLDTQRSIHCFYQFGGLPAGYGWLVTTYMGDGDPLPSFSGEPRLLPLAGGPEEVLEALWGALNAENRIALAVKAIPLAGGQAVLHLRNRYVQR